MICLNTIKVFIWAHKRITETVRIIFVAKRLIVLNCYYAYSYYTSKSIQSRCYFHSYSKTLSKVTVTVTPFSVTAFTVTTELRLQQQAKCNVPCVSLEKNGKQVNTNAIFSTFKEKQIKN